jgi:hypothetical protein
MSLRIAYRTVGSMDDPLPSCSRNPFVFHCEVCEAAQQSYHVLGLPRARESRIRCKHRLLSLVWVVSCVFKLCRG